MFQYVILVIAIGLLTPGWAASHHPQDFLKQIVGSKREGEAIVQHYCAMCHAKKPLVQLGAPSVGDVSAWLPRVQQGHDVLMKHLNEGLNAMPARGGCFECSDRQLWLSVLAMVPSELCVKYHLDR